MLLQMIGLLFFLMAEYFTVYITCYNFLFEDGYISLPKILLSGQDFLFRVPVGRVNMVLVYFEGGRWKWASNWMLNVVSISTYIFVL